MDLISIAPEYYEFVRLLRLDDRVRNSFLDDAYITSEEQQTYMKKHADNYYICLLYDGPAGYVGVIDDDIRICTHPDFAGKGVGKFMLKEIMKHYPNAAGRIKEDNIPSIKLFESCQVKYTLI
jgi:GNAT superfamily N-acetyltransferase